jgi:HPt (histidine-containing phosphotransfer) domain-containing protein
MVDHELNELRREFLAEARSKVDEMTTALDGDGNATVMERLAYLAHQLKGSGGSYGYQRISADAAQLEKTVEASGDGNGFKKTELARLVTELRNEIDRAQSDLAV